VLLSEFPEVPTGSSKPPAGHWSLAPVAVPFSAAAEPLVASARSAIGRAFKDEKGGHDDAAEAAYFEGLGSYISAVKAEPNAENSAKLKRATVFIYQDPCCEFLKISLLFIP